MRTKADCRTQWHVLVAYLHQRRDWVATFELQSRHTDFGFIGSSGEQRVRELARNAPCIPPELRDRVEKKREGKFEYFCWRPSMSPKLAAARRVALFDAGAPAEQIFA